MPFVWGIARHCLELPYGAIRHFPAGNYDEQVSTLAGRTELDLMTTAHSAWYTFEHKSAGKWGDSERKFVQWVAHDPPEPPTRRLDFIVEALWGASYWAFKIMDRMRDADG